MKILLVGFKCITEELTINYAELLHPNYLNDCPENNCASSG